MRISVYAAAALPFAWLLAALMRWHHDMPYLDQWPFVTLLGKSYDGTWRFADLWAQHNEHRLVVPRLAMLGLAHLSHWNTLWELAVNVALGTLLFITVVCVVLRASKRAGVADSYHVMPLLSMLVFSMSQWQNWVRGWQMQEFMSLLAALGGLALLGVSRPSWKRLGAAMLLGTVATFSFANGIVFWPIGLAVLFANDAASGGWRPRCLVAWAGVSIAVTAAVLWGYRGIDYHPGPWRFYELTVGYAYYLLAFLGAPVVSYDARAAAVCGGIGLIVFATLGIIAFRRGSLPIPDLSVMASFGLYAVSSAMITGYGRLAFGVEQAMSSRYITLSNPLWIAILGLGLIMGSRASWGFRRGAQCAAIFLGALLMVNAAYGTWKWSEHYQYEVPAREALLSGGDERLLERLHPDPGLILRQREILRKYRLSVFRDLPD